MTNPCRTSILAGLTAYDAIELAKTEYQSLLPRAAVRLIGPGANRKVSLEQMMSYLRGIVTVPIRTVFHNRRGRGRLMSTIQLEQENALYAHTDLLIVHTHCRCMWDVGNADFVFTECFWIMNDPLCKRGKPSSGQWTFLHATCACRWTSVRYKSQETSFEFSFPYTTTLNITLHIKSLPASFYRRLLDIVCFGVSIRHYVEHGKESGPCLFQSLRAI